VTAQPAPTLDKTWSAATAYAERMGLRLDISQDASGMLHVSVDHEARDPDDWSLVPTEIAIGHDPAIVADKSIAQLRDMEPRLTKMLDALAPEQPDRLAIAGGLSSDGVITALRVQRDGTVRLSLEDIDAIADAVVRRMRGLDVIVEQALAHEPVFGTGITYGGAEVRGKPDHDPT